MWGGISANGFSIVLFHARKKLSADEWGAALAVGQLRRSLASINPARPRGPWTILCDGERFLHSAASILAYRKQKISIWKVPPRSPDLNPVEQFWSWLRRHLPKLDLADARAKRTSLDKAKYKKRVRSVCCSTKAKAVATNIVNSFRKTCAEVVRVKGAAVYG